MVISKTEAKALLERAIFEGSPPQEWVEDVWGLSPMLGDSAAKLWDAFEVLVEYCPEERLEALLHSFYRDRVS